MSTRICKRCLLKDVDQDAYFRSVYEYIESLDESLKAPDPDYQKRLSACRECDELVNGMCRICGCFVEVRAAKKQNYCPSPGRYW